MTSWVGGELDVIGDVTVFGHPVVLTWDLIRVAGLVAAFSALQFTFSTLTDQTYREEFFEGMLAEMREPWPPARSTSRRWPTTPADPPDG